MSNISDLLKCTEIPLFYPAALSVENRNIANVEEAVRNCLKRAGTLERIRPGERVAITAGSREIAGIDKILRTLIESLKEVGAQPFLFPAMGSHGGANPEGQKEVIAQYGITEESMGVPIRSSMETVCVGETAEGIPVHVDRWAYGADHIIPVGRIKPHTDFKGAFESGLMKMLAIGVGKQEGANICHKLGMTDMSKHVRAIGRAIIERRSVPFGIGIIENAFHGTYRVEAIPGERIDEEEPALLREAKALVPVLPFEKVDVVVCERMGKEISGTGMDSNVIGRSASLGISRPFAERVGVFALTEKSHGNGNGMGLADAVTERFFRTVEFDQTYPNAITSAETTAVKLPAVMPTDELCVKFLIKTCTQEGKRGCRIVWIKDTLSLDSFYVSEGLFEEDTARDSALKLLPQPFRAAFDAAGAFTGFIEEKVT
jgi:hypothetical protein